jgi:hypothetical protein
MKHRIVYLLQKYLLNPPIKFLFAVGVILPGYARFWCSAAGLVLRRSSSK